MCIYFCHILGHFPHKDGIVRIERLFQLIKNHHLLRHRRGVLFLIFLSLYTQRNFFELTELTTCTQTWHSKIALCFPFSKYLVPRKKKLQEQVHVMYVWFFSEQLNGRRDRICPWEPFLPYSLTLQGFSIDINSSPGCDLQAYSDSGFRRCCKHYPYETSNTTHTDPRTLPIWTLLRPICCEDAPVG